MYRELGLLLLGEHFTEYSESDDAIATFKRGMSVAVRLLHGREQDEYLFQALADLLTTQWTNPILNKMMNGDEVEKDVGSCMLFHDPSMI